MSESPRFTWEEALKEFLLHCKAHKARKTLLYYKVQLGRLVAWAVENDVPFESFGRRHMDRYLIYRAEQGLKPITVHHDAICAKKFLSWCAHEEILDRSLLADYKVRTAPVPARYMPTQAEIDALIKASADYWDVSRHREIRYYDVKKRIFHRERNYAIIVGLLDTAARIGEILALKVDDYRAKERQVVIRMSKGREPRALPVGDGFATALDEWLKVRRRVMQAVPPQEDSGWLFINEYGEKMETGGFIAAMKNLVVWAELPNAMTLHCLRRFSLNKLAKVSLLGAQQIAGHKEAKTTLIYTKLDPDFLREVHSRAAVIPGRVLASKRGNRKKLV